MDANNILQADVLDIIFEGKNKEYGAYDLRKTYNGRLIKAMLSTATVLLLLLIGYYVSGMTKSKHIDVPKVDDLELTNVQPEKKEIPPVQPPKIEVPKVATIRFVTTRIVPDKEVKPDEKPPEQEKLEDSKIGTVNQAGITDDGITAPPASDGGKGVVEAPKKEEDDADKIFNKVEIESSFPGGMAAWSRFLNKNLHAPDEAASSGISEATIVVQFIVDKEGNVTDVQAISGPDQGGLKEEAVRVIRKSGKWTPAIQNGRQVKSYKRQPIIFRFEE